MANELRPCPCDIGDRFDYGGRGQEVQVEHIKAYVSKPSTSTDKAVIVIHDIFGWELPNTRYIADMLTANGYVAILPDFFVGQEPWKPSNDWATFYDWVKSRDAGKIDKEVDVVMKYLKEHCGAKNIGVIGFCWGGAAVQHLMLKNPHLKTGVSLYGVIEFFDDKSSLLHPTFFIFAEKDEIVPLEQENPSYAFLPSKDAAYEEKFEQQHCQLVLSFFPFLWMRVIQEHQKFWLSVSNFITALNKQYYIEKLAESFPAGNLQLFFKHCKKRERRNIPLPPSID